MQEVSGTIKAIYRYYLENFLYFFDSLYSCHLSQNFALFLNTKWKYLRHNLLQFSVHPQWWRPTMTMLILSKLTIKEWYLRWSVVHQSINLVVHFIVLIVTLCLHCWNRSYTVLSPKGLANSWADMVTDRQHVSNILAEKWSPNVRPGSKGAIQRGCCCFRILWKSH